MLLLLVVVLMRLMLGSKSVGDFMQTVSEVLFLLLKHMLRHDCRWRYRWHVVTLRILPNLRCMSPEREPKADQI